jgi:type I restriction enzyme S subunit
VKAVWPTKTIGEVCDVVNGGTPKTGVAVYWDGPHQWVTPAEMGKRSSPYIGQTTRTITNEGLQNSSARLLPPHSVILSSRAPIGHLVINTEPMATNQGCRGLIPSDRIDHKFLYYYLTSIVVLLNDLGTGATFKELSGGKLKEVPVPVPPLPEQQRIVGIFDQAFDGIATAKANAEKNRQNARALFESHLQSVFTQRGEGWVDTTIGEHIRFIDYRGRTPEKTESGLRLITAKNVKMGYLQKTPMEFVAPDSYDSWMTRGIPRIGDVLFTTEAPLANVAQLDTVEKVVFAQRIIIMQPDSTKLDATFLKYLLLSQPIQQRIHTKGTGATVKGIKASLLKLIEISFPKSVADQKQIVAKLDALREETQHLESLYQRKLAALDALKQSLLHQAFSGQL